MHNHSFKVHVSHSIILLPSSHIIPLSIISHAHLPIAVLLPIRMYYYKLKVIKRRQQCSLAELRTIDKKISCAFNYRSSSSRRLSNPNSSLQRSITIYVLLTEHWCYKASTHTNDSVPCPPANISHRVGFLCGKQ